MTLSRRHRANLVPYPLPSQFVRLTCFLAALLSTSQLGATDPEFTRAGVFVESPSAWIFEPAGPPTSEPISRIATDPLGTRHFLPFDWTPGRTYVMQPTDSRLQWKGTAPLKPAPKRIATIPLEDVSQMALSGSPPDSIVKFAPDSRRLAIGTLSGRLRIVDAFTGQILHQQRIAEGQIKQLTWSPDGEQLYVGEQSPDAYLFALATGTLDEPGDYGRLWQVRLADELGTSRPPADDRFGIYSLPAVHDLHVADDGRLFVAGLHSWFVGNEHRHQAAIYAIGADGKPIWRFPSAAPLALSITHIAIDREGSRLVFLTNRPGKVQEPRVEIDTIYQLDARDGTPSGSVTVEPLRPHFQRIEAWDSVALSADAQHAAVGLADGRGLLFSSSRSGLELTHTFPLGTPLLVGEIPITAACSYTRFFGGQLFLQTQNTHIPFGSALAAHQAPSAHRGGNTLTVYNTSGQVDWRYRGPYSLSGQWSDRSLPDGSGRWLLVTCREVPGAAEPGQFGCLLFDLQAPGGGREKLVYHYPTEGPVIFHADISPDGRLIAVTETPYPTSDGRTLYGNHQVHVVH